jgi:phosphonate degradation associated HDIG domain protein
VVVSRAVITLTEIRALFDAKGGCQYSGEPVIQLEHALQSAQLAEQAEAGAALVTACLLHDFGHMSNDMGETPTLRGVDDKHQFHGVSALTGMFGQAVLTPIRLHVDAKRYLCATDAGYWAGLSADSKRSLELQGGTFSAVEAAKFIAQPYAQDAVRLRRWDDLAKVAGIKTPDLAYYLKTAAQCAA